MRASRLMSILLLLQNRGRLTAEQLAAHFEVSIRTIYRDISQLLAKRVPIRGEAGIGYVLEDGFDMPPLMLTAVEFFPAALPEAGG